MARLLIVDDDPTILVMISDILTKYAKELYKSDWRLHITTAPSALSALELVQENNFELIVTDILMAKMDGWEFIKAIRKKFPQFDVPILVISAVDAIDLEYECMRNGASGWFRKPIRPKEFAAEVFKLIQAR